VFAAILAWSVESVSMVLASFILPPDLGGLHLPDDVRERLAAFWAGWWGPLRDELRAAPPPEEDSENERQVLARFLSGLLEITREFGEPLRPLLRARFVEMFEDLIAQAEKEVAEDRRFGLRLFGRAVGVMSEILEIARALLPRDWLQHIPTDHDAEVSTALDDEVGRAIARLELAVFMTFDLLHEDSTERFLVWARQASRAAMRAKPLVELSSLPVKSQAWQPRSAEEERATRSDRYHEAAKLLDEWARDPAEPPFDAGAIERLRLRPANR
jgi:hypothetical protein